jgi:hypothetical protein
VRGPFFVLAAVGALAVALPAAASQRSTIHFKVVSAKATATLTFHTETTTTVSDGRVGLAVQRKAAGQGSVPGRVLFPLKGKLSEKVKTTRGESGSPEYQEKTCANTKKVAGRGGVTLRRVGSKVEVRWAFPQAKPSFCRGPSAGKSVTTLMKKLYPASRFSAKSLTVVLGGSKSVDSGTTTLTYRWSASITLSRTS